MRNVDFHLIDFSDAQSFARLGKPKLQFFLGGTRRNDLFFFLLSLSQLFWRRSTYLPVDVGVPAGIKQEVVSTRALLVYFVVPIFFCGAYLNILCQWRSPPFPQQRRS